MYVLIAEEKTVWRTSFVCAAEHSFLTVLIKIRIIRERI